ncbi:hypothetical protein Droror1_Dr00011577 [Drosera rotundifolia]
MITPAAVAGGAELGEGEEVAPPGPSAGAEDTVGGAEVVAGVLDGAGETAGLLNGEAAGDFFGDFEAILDAGAAALGLGAGAAARGLGAGAWMRGLGDGAVARGLGAGATTGAGEDAEAVTVNFWPASQWPG